MSVQLTGRAGGLVVLDGIFIDGGIDNAQVLEDAGGLGALAGAQEIWDGDRREERDDRDNHHNFHEREGRFILE